MNDRSLAVYFRDLSNMLVSGIGLEHSLRTLSETSVDSQIKDACGKALGFLAEGSSLGAALSASGGLPREAVVAITAGETAGDLPTVFLMLGDYFELKSEMKSRVFEALAYPLVVIGILLCVLVYMAVDVFPKVATLLPVNAAGSSVTGMLIAIALFLKAWGWLAGAGLAAMIVSLILVSRSFPLRFKAGLARLPLIGQIIKSRELALGFFTLYILQKSGASLETALREAANVSGGLTGRHLLDCSSYLAGGLALSESIRRDSYFPRFTSDTLRIGEESGRFEEYFERLYRVFYRLFQSRMENLAGSVRPLMLLAAGGLIALIAIGFLQPLYGNLANMGMP